MTDASNMNRLINSASKTPVALFLGSGVMAGIIPLWNDLLKELIKKSLLYRFVNQYTAQRLDNIASMLIGDGMLTTYDQALIAKLFLGDQYKLFLKEILYSRYNKYNLHKIPLNSTFHAICRLCGNSWVHGVVTYNYDSFFEDYSSQSACSAKRKFFAVVGNKPEQHNTANDLPFYHVHGYIPDSNKNFNVYADDLVLSRDEYFQNMLEPYSWQTTTQLHFLRNYTCLFVGASLRDWNMLRMLNYAKKYTRANDIYAIMHEDALLKINSEKNTVSDEEQTFIVKMNASLLQEFGVNLIISGKTSATVATKLNELTKCIKTQRLSNAGEGGKERHVLKNRYRRTRRITKRRFRITRRK